MVTGMTGTGVNLTTMTTTGGTVAESIGTETDLRLETNRGFPKRVVDGTDFENPVGVLEWAKEP